MQNNTTDQKRAKVASDKVGAIKLWAFAIRSDQSTFLSFIKSWFRILFIMIHEFSETAISLRASALTYTIVLSMVPMLAMSTALLKGMGSDNQLRIAAYKFIDQLEPEKQQKKSTAQNQTQEFETTAPAQPAVQDSVPAVPAGNDIDTGEAVTNESLTAHLRNAVDTIFDYVDKTNFAAIGAFGIVGLLVTVILVLSTVEAAMNAIWHSKQGRSIFRKIMDYMALLILLPISINVALAGDAILESPTIMAYLNTIIPSAWAVRMLLKLLPFLFVILSLMIMYLFFPTVKVKTYAALSGAIFAAFFWFLVQKAYIIMQIGVAKYNAIYGSFATVPLFLIWVQLGWTFILLGASLAYAMQNRNQYYLPGAGGSPQRNLQVAFDIINTVYANFEIKKQTLFDDIVKANTGEQPGNILEIINKLIAGGLLHQVEDGNKSYVPAAPSEIIEAREVTRLILGHENIPTVGGEFSHTVIKAAEQAIPPEAFPALEHTPPDHITFEHTATEQAETGDTDTSPSEMNNEKTL